MSLRALRLRLARWVAPRDAFVGTAFTITGRRVTSLAPNGDELVIKTVSDPPSRAMPAIERAIDYLSGEICAGRGARSGFGETYGMEAQRVKASLFDALRDLRR